MQGVPGRRKAQDRSSLVEHFADNEGVGGSIPLGPIWPQSVTVARQLVTLLARVQLSLGPLSNEIDTARGR